MIALMLLGGLALYLTIAVMATRLLVRQVKSKRTRWLIVLTSVLVFFLIPTGDEIAGRIYLNHLCATKADVKVYKTVELPAEYWDERGKPRFMAANGFVDMKLLPNRYGWLNINEPYIDSVIRIRKLRWQLVDKETKDVLGERISYMRYFGWINRFSPAPNIGESCRDLGGEFNRDELSRKEREQEHAFFLGIFKPATITR